MSPTTSKEGEEKGVKYFSMYTGIGGAELGMPEHWECVGFSEIEPRAVEIYQRHFPNHKNYGDADTINPDELPDFDFLIGGFPCQSFSIAGNRRGFDETRGTQFFNIARIIKVKKPKSLLLENVKGLLSHDGGKTFETILRTLDELGYDTEWGVFDGSDFSAGQRPRCFIYSSYRHNQNDVGERAEQAPPLYSCLSQRTRITDETLQEAGGGAERIIRTFAVLPDWLDSWDSIYGTESKAGERHATQRRESDN